MPSREDFTFVLFPWENRGAPFDPRPDCVTTAKVQGYSHLFLLKVRANRIFFRLAEDGTRIWGTGEIQGDPLSFWQHEIEAGRIARLFTHKARLDLNRYHDRTEMAVLISGECQVWLCEWCSDAWWPSDTPLVLQKYVRTHRKLSIWQPQWQPRLHKLFNQNAGQMFDRLMPESERTATALHWVCGSEKQLEELLQHLCLANFDALCELERKLNSRHPFSRESDNLSFNLRSDSIDSDASLKFGWWGINDKVEILGVFLKYNRVVGVNWERGHAKSVRGEWNYSSFVRTFRFQKLQPRTSQREQSHSFLRDWLPDKAPTSKIEEWLAPRA